MQRTFVQFLFLVMLLKHLEASPIPCEGEADNLNNQLNHFTKRFKNIMKTSFDTVFDKEMHALIANFHIALESTNLKDKEKLLENYMQNLNDNFVEYLQLKLDEQYLNEEIRMEEWYFQQLLPQLEPRLAMEVAEFLPLYQRALSAPQLDEKYEIFANIEENFSNLDEEPKNVVIINAQLIYFKDFLSYLLKAENLYVKYENDLRALLLKVESALNGDELMEKFDSVYRFDDIEHPFGHYLSCMINDFEVFKFG